MGSGWEEVEGGKAMDGSNGGIVMGVLHGLCVSVCMSERYESVRYESVC